MLLTAAFEDLCVFNRKLDNQPLLLVLLVLSSSLSRRIDSVAIEPPESHQCMAVGEVFNKPVASASSRAALLVNFASFSPLEHNFSLSDNTLTFSLTQLFSFFHSLCGPHHFLLG